MVNCFLHCKPQTNCARQPGCNQTWESYEIFETNINYCKFVSILWQQLNLFCRSLETFNLNTDTLTFFKDKNRTFRPCFATLGRRPWGPGSLPPPHPAPPRSRPASPPGPAGWAGMSFDQQIVRRRWFWYIFGHIVNDFLCLVTWWWPKGAMWLTTSLPVAVDSNVTSHNLTIMRMAMMMEPWSLETITWSGRPLVFEGQWLSSSWAQAGDLLQLLLLGERERKSNIPLSPGFLYWTCLYFFPQYFLFHKPQCSLVKTLAERFWHCNALFDWIYLRWFLAYVLKNCKSLNQMQNIIKHLHISDRSLKTN